MDFDYPDYADFPPGNNRRVSSVTADPYSRGPGLNKIPGRIQTYRGDDRLASTAFGFPRRPPPRRPGGVDCDYYTEDLCLEVRNYPM